MLCQLQPTMRASVVCGYFLFPFKLLFKVSLSESFLMQLDTLISNIVSVFKIRKKNDLAGRLKVNFGSFRHTVRSLVS